MAVWFNGLMSLDFFVSNARQMLDVLVERLVVPRPDVELPVQGKQPDGFYLPPNSGAEIAWVRPSVWSADHLQIIAMRTLSTDERRAAIDQPLNSIYGILTGVLASQGNRPIKAHQVTPVMRDEDLLDLVRFWDKVGVPYHVTKPTELVPIPNVFPGWHGDPPRFDPSRVLIPWEFPSPVLIDLLPDIDREYWREIVAENFKSLHLPHAARGDPPAGALLRVVGRSFLVADVDATLETLRGGMNLGTSADEYKMESFSTYRSLRFLPAPTAGLGTVAALEFVQPTSEQHRGATYLEMFGPGPFAIRLGTNSVEACCRDLDHRGTRWSAVDEREGTNRVLVDPAQLCGAYVEIESL
jgi:hypothetical protein